MIENISFFPVLLLHQSNVTEKFESERRCHEKNEIIKM